MIKMSFSFFLISNYLFFNLICGTHARLTFLRDQIKLYNKKKTIYRN